MVTVDQTWDLSTSNGTPPRSSVRSSNSNQLGSMHHRPHHSHHHPHHGRLHHHTTSALHEHEHEHGLNVEAANIAHFDALAHDFDKRHPFAAEFADRLTRTLLRRRPSISISTSTASQTQSSGSGSGSGGGFSLVLDEDATSVLDYACGSGI